MKAILQKQINEMTDDELKDVLKRDYLRRLNRYRMTDNFFRKKYGMDFEGFEKTKVVEKTGYTFEVESDAQEWELAIDGIKTMEKRLKELSGGD
jgi:hypothetical protein